MSTEHTQFVFFEIYNVMLSEICKDFKVKLDSRMCTDVASENIVGTEGKTNYCYIHKYIANEMGLPGSRGLARWFADMIIYTKIGNKQAADFIRAHADEIDQYTSSYEIEYEHCDPDSSESCMLIEKFDYQKGNSAQQCGFDECGWAAIWETHNLDQLETYMPKNCPYPLQSFEPKPEEAGNALGNLLADGFGDRFCGFSCNSSFVRNIAENTLITEYPRTYLSRKTIPYSPAPKLLSLAGMNVLLYGKFKSVKLGDLKKAIKAKDGKCAAAYSRKVNIVLIGDDVGSHLDRADFSTAWTQVETAIARKYLGEEVIFATEADFFNKNAWILD